MKTLLAALVWAIATPVLAQGTTLPKDDAPPPAPEGAAVLPDVQEAPPPPGVAIPGIDVPAEPPPAAAPAPPPSAPEPAGASDATYLPTAPIRVVPHIDRGAGYFGMGIGFGTANFARESFAGSGAALFALRAGKIFSDQLLVGPEVMLTGQYDEWAENTMAGAGLSSIMMQVMVFPVIDRPFNVATGVGWGSGLQISRLTDVDGDDIVVATGNDGVSWMAGLGWDFFAGRGWNLGVQARYDGVHFFTNESNTRAFALQIWLNSY